MASERTRNAVFDALDRHGSDIALWPDAAAAAEARRRLISDPAFRARYEDVIALETRLSALVGETERVVRASGAEQRVASRVMARTRPAPPLFGRGRVGWAAAAIGIAASLGSLAQITVLGPGAATSLEIVVLEPLFVGAASGAQ